MFASGASLALLALAVSLDGFGVGASYGIRGIRIPASSVFIIAACSGAVVWLAMTAGGWLTGLLPHAVARVAGAVLLIAVGLWALAQLLRGADGGATGRGSDEAGKADGSERCAGDANVASTACVAGAAGDASAASAASTASTAYAASAEVAASSAGASAGSPDVSCAGASPLRSVARIELRRLGLVICVLRAPQAADMDRSGTISASEAVLLGFALSLDALGAGFGAAMVGFPALPASLLIAAASGMFLMAGMRFGRKFALRFGGAKAVSVLPGLILIATGIARLMDL